MLTLRADVTAASVVSHKEKGKTQRSRLKSWLKTFWSFPLCSMKLKLTLEYFYRRNWEPSADVWVSCESRHNNTSSSLLDTWLPRHSLFTAFIRKESRRKILFENNVETNLELFYKQQVHWRTPSDWRDVRICTRKITPWPPSVSSNSLQPLFPFYFRKHCRSFQGAK